MADGPVFVAKSIRRTKDGKTRSREIGAVWPTKNPDVLMGALEAMPAPEDGVFRIMLVRPDQERNQRRQPSRSYDNRRDDPPPSWGRGPDDRQQRGNIPPIGEDLDDEIPF